MSRPGIAEHFWYYNSEGSGSIVYPKVLDTQGNVLWDGRKQDNWKYWRLEIGESVSVDLGNDAKIANGTVVCAGFDVKAGVDRNDLSDDFTYTNGCNITDKWIFYGPVDNGTIQYDGWSTPEALKKKIADEQINHKEPGKA